MCVMDTLASGKDCYTAKVLNNGHIDVSAVPIEMYETYSDVKKSWLVVKRK